MSWWNPVTWVESAYDWTASELASAARWTGSEVGKLAGWTTSEVEKVGYDTAQFVEHGISAVAHVFHLLLAEVHHELSILSRDVSEVGHWAGSAATWIAHADGWVIQHIEMSARVIEHDIIAPAVHALEQTVHSVEHEALAAVHGVAHDLSWLEGHVVMPAVHELERLPGQVNAEIGTAVSTVERDVISPIAHDVGWLMDNAPKVIEWVITNGPAIAKLVFEAADWLVIMGEHSITDLEGMVELFSGQVKLSDVAGSQQAAMAEHLPDFESILARVLA